MAESITRDLSPPPLDDFNDWIRSQPSYAEVTACRVDAASDLYFVRTPRAVDETPQDVAPEKSPIREGAPLWHGHVANQMRRTPALDPAKFTAEEWKAWNVATHAVIPWWFDVSDEAQRRRAIKKWTGSAKARDISAYWHKVRRSQDRMRQGDSARDVAQEQGCTVRNVYYQQHLEVPLEHYGVALSEVLQAKTATQSEMPSPTPRGGVVVVGSSFFAESRIVGGVGGFSSPVATNQPATGEPVTFDELLAEAQRIFGVTASGSLDTACEVPWGKPDTEGHNQLYYSELAVPFDPHRLHQTLLQAAGWRLFLLRSLQKVERPPGPYQRCSMSTSPQWCFRYSATSRR